MDRIIDSRYHEKAKEIQSRTRADQLNALKYLTELMRRPTVDERLPSAEEWAVLLCFAAEGFTGQ